MDVSTKFQLYYGPEVPKMIDWEKIQNLSEDDPEREAAELRFRAATRTDKYMVRNIVYIFLRNRKHKFNYVNSISFLLSDLRCPT